MSSRTDYVARTATGVLISTFATRAQAVAWAETKGLDFPGHTIAVREEQLIVHERVLRRDRSMVEARPQ